jgi:hypothetical protein
MTDQPEFGLIEEIAPGRKVIVALQAGALEHGIEKNGSPRRVAFDAGAAFLMTDEAGIVAGPVDQADLVALARALLRGGRGSTDTSKWRALAAAVIAFHHA